MSKDLHELFLRYHMPHHGTLFGYLLAALHDFHKAEDILQQITLILWKKFGEFQRSEPYLPWAFGVTRRELARHFRDRNKHVASLSMKILDNVADAVNKEEEKLIAERSALQRCLEKLSERQQQLVRMRYESGLSLNELADRLSRTMASVNMMLVRIRRSLLDCTKHALVQEI